MNWKSLALGSVLFLAGLGVAVGSYLLHGKAITYESVQALIIQPCGKPLTFRVATVDQRFPLTNEEFVKTLEDAASLWNTAAGKTVLVYAPNDPNALPVSFVYDARQQAVVVGQHIDTVEAGQNQERDSITALEAQYKIAADNYGKAVDAYNTDSSAYAQEVQKVNEGGGADRQTYEHLQTTKLALDQKGYTLDTQKRQLEGLASQVQAKIAAFNADVRNINNVVRTFNSTVGGEFEEGLYAKDAKGARIEIFAFKSKAELLHTVAHEFGHALDLDHNQNTASIMYPYNKSGTTLSVDDISALKKACNL